MRNAVILLKDIQNFPYFLNYHPWCCNRIAIEGNTMIPEKKTKIPYIVSGRWITHNLVFFRTVPIHLFFKLQIDALPPPKKKKGHDLTNWNTKKTILGVLFFFSNILVQCRCHEMEFVFVLYWQYSCRRLIYDIDGGFEEKVRHQWSEFFSGTGRLNEDSPCRRSVSEKSPSVIFYKQRGLIMNRTSDEEAIERFFFFFWNHHSHLLSRFYELKMKFWSIFFFFLCTFCLSMES